MTIKVILILREHFWENLSHCMNEWTANSPSQLGVGGATDLQQKTRAGELSVPSPGLRAELPGWGCITSRYLNQWTGTSDLVSNSNRERLFQASLCNMCRGVRIKSQDDTMIHHLWTAAQRLTYFEKGKQNKTMKINNPDLKRLQAYAALIYQRD